MFAVILASPLLTCGDDDWYILVELVLPADHDPFEGVNTVRLTASGPPPMEAMTAQIPYRKGGQVSLSSLSEGKDRVITVEGLDGTGAVLSRGQSEPFEVTKSSPERVRVPFSRCSGQWFRDADGDGFGDSSATDVACDAASGYVEDNSDCDDQDKEAFPGQDQWLGRPTTGNQDFDFNCDGTEEQQYPEVINCALAPPSCKGEGWKGSVPACGGEGTYVTCIKEGSACVEDVGETRTQHCQ
jgi:hypothetical protein